MIETGPFLKSSRSAVTALTRVPEFTSQLNKTYAKLDIIQEIYALDFYNENKSELYSKKVLNCITKHY